MNQLDKYLLKVETDSGKNVSEHLNKTVSRISRDCFENFNYTKKISAILLGHVQSGKTGNLIGLVANCIDQKFKYFVVLTSDSVLLYDQTLSRFQSSLEDTEIYGEDDEDSFLANSLKKPCVIVLKKNQSVLRKWLYRIESIDKTAEEPLILIDDEADAASLNTKVNQKSVSTINLLIRQLIDRPPSSLYLQTTATPFANLLLSEDSTTKPKFITRFEPSDSYMGGNFFYGEDSKSFEIIDDSDSELALDNDLTVRPQGLIKATAYFVSMVITAIRTKKATCNFLIHPSHKIGDHTLVANKVESIIRDFLRAAESENQLLLDLIPSIGAKNTLSEIKDALRAIKILVVNSENELPELSKGFHVVVGGNCLGRGLTIPQLNVCYYTRNVKSPQADTLLQHSRIFGYDRDRLNAKVFLTQPILLRFRGIVSGVEALHNSVDLGSLGQLKYFLPPKINPTRKNVVDKNTYISLAGGVNYFLESSDPICTKNIDTYLDNCPEELIVSIKWLAKLLDLFKSEDDLLNQFQFALSILPNSDNEEIHVYIRKDRNIGKGTGTLLSPDDRLLSQKYNKKTVVFLYRIIGDRNKGWLGEPLWIPNIKFPNEYVFIGNES
jgi:hypothetical protein